MMMMMVFFIYFFLLSSIYHQNFIKDIYIISQYTSEAFVSCIQSKSVFRLVHENNMTTICAKILKKLLQWEKE